MEYDDFKIKYADPDWALCFNNFYKSISICLNPWGMPLFRFIQYGLGLILIGSLVLYSMIYGYGNLVGIPPVICAMFAGRINLNIFEIIILCISAFILSALAYILQASATHFTSIPFLLCYFGVGSLKFIFMKIMGNSAYKNENKFNRLNANKNLSWWRVG